MRNHRRDASGRVTGGCTAPPETAKHNEVCMCRRNHEARRSCGGDGGTRDWGGAGAERKVGRVCEKLSL